MYATLHFVFIKRLVRNFTIAPNTTFVDINGCKTPKLLWELLLVVALNFVLMCCSKDGFGSVIHVKLGVSLNGFQSDIEKEKGSFPFPERPYMFA